MLTILNRFAARWNLANSRVRTRTANSRGSKASREVNQDSNRLKPASRASLRATVASADSKGVGSRTSRDSRPANRISKGNSRAPEQVNRVNKVSKASKRADKASRVNKLVGKESKASRVNKANKVSRVNKDSRDSKPAGKASRGSKANRVSKVSKDSKDRASKDSRVANRVRANKGTSKAAVLAAAPLIQDQWAEARRLVDSASSKASFANASPILKN